MIKTKPSRLIYEFVKRANKVMFHQGPQGSGSEHKPYYEWKNKINAITTKEGTSYDQAVVNAAKEFSCLGFLLTEYNFSEDYGTLSTVSSEPSGVVCEEKEQTYREDLRWAKSAAGRFLRTKVPPVRCPNDSSWYLYCQAIADPKDFLGRVGQVESKGDQTSEVERDTNRFYKKSVKEIDDMLFVMKENEDNQS